MLLYSYKDLRIIPQLQLLLQIVMLTEQQVYLKEFLILQNKQVNLQIYFL